MAQLAQCTQVLDENVMARHGPCPLRHPTGKIHQDTMLRFRRFIVQEHNSFNHRIHRILPFEPGFSPDLPAVRHLFGDCHRQISVNL
jgi:hypothetical protein